MHCMEQYLHLGPDAAALRGRCMSCVRARSSCEGYAIFFLLSVGAFVGPLDGAAPPSQPAIPAEQNPKQPLRLYRSTALCTTGPLKKPRTRKESEKKRRQLRTATLLCAPRVCGVCARHVHCPGPKRAAKNRIGSLQLKELKCRREC